MAAGGVFGWVLTGERVDAGREAVVHTGSYPARTFHLAAAARLFLLWPALHSSSFSSSSRWTCLCLLLSVIHWLSSRSRLRSWSLRRSWREVREEKGQKVRTHEKDLGKHTGPDLLKVWKLDSRHVVGKASLQGAKVYTLLMLRKVREGTTSSTHFLHYIYVLNATDRPGTTNTCGREKL